MFANIFTVLVKRVERVEALEVEKFVRCDICKRSTSHGA
jgi:hypothetical protein